MQDQSSGIRGELPSREHTLDGAPGDSKPLGDSLQAPTVGPENGHLITVECPPGWADGPARIPWAGARPRPG